MRPLLCRRSQLISFQTPMNRSRPSLWGMICHYTAAAMVIAAGAATSSATSHGSVYSTDTAFALERELFERCKICHTPCAAVLPHARPAFRASLKI